MPNGKELKGFWEKGEPIGIGVMLEKGNESKSEGNCINAGNFFEWGKEKNDDGNDEKALQGKVEYVERTTGDIVEENDKIETKTIEETEKHISQF